MCCCFIDVHLPQTWTTKKELILNLKPILSVGSIESCGLVSACTTRSTSIHVHREINEWQNKKINATISVILCVDNLIKNVTDSVWKWKINNIHVFHFRSFISFSADFFVLFCVCPYQCGIYSLLIQSSCVEALSNHCNTTPIKTKQKQKVVVITIWRTAQESLCEVHVSVWRSRIINSYGDIVKSPFDQLQIFTLNVHNNNAILRLWQVFWMCLRICRTDTKWCHTIKIAIKAQ